MATNTHLINITRKTVRIGTTQLPGIGPAAPASVAVDLESLGSGGRRDLQNLLSSGSLVPGATTSAVVLASIDRAARSRNRLGAVALPDLTHVTLDLTTMTNFQRRDLIQLLASGSLLAGDTASTASVTVYNISSKPVRIGAVVVPPFRTAGANRATDVITLSPTPAAKAGYLIAYNGTNIGSPTEYVQGTNLTAAAIQTDLRTATGDAGAAVTGSDDTGPFTVTYSDGFKPLSALVVTASVTDVITLTSFDNTDSVKVTYNAVESGTITNGTNATSAGVQTVIRALGGTAAAVRVSGTTNAGPYTVAWPAGVTPLSVLTITSGTGGAAGTVVRTAMTGTDVQSGADPAATQVTDVAALTDEQRRDLQMRLAAGQVVPLA